LISRRWRTLGFTFLQHALAIGVIYSWIQAILPMARHPAGDGPHILGTATRLAQLLLDGEWETFVICFSTLLGPHPPFAYVPFTIAEVLFSGQAWSHLAGGAILLWLCWDGIRRLGGGLVGLLWLMCAAPIWLQAENAGIDLAAGACAIQSLSHLAASQRLRSRWHALMWGAWIGAAFMTKYTAPMFLWAPCFIAGWWTVRWRRWDRLAAGIGGFCIVALPWWSTHWKQVYGYVVASGDASSGLLTNKAIVQGPWHAYENLSWYPAATVDAIGWWGLGFILIALPFSRRARGATQRSTDRWAAKRTALSSPSLICASAIIGGWLFLNAQSQRQDRYILPAGPIAAALIGGSWLAIPSIPIAIWNLESTRKIYTERAITPSQREYSHEIGTAGESWPVPAKAYWPVTQDPDSWGVDTALQKTRKYQGSDHGTVGFLLEEEGGAPGYGIILRRATALGYRWHIATVMVVQPQGQKRNDSNRPLASVFVGPFLYGEWPSRSFDVLLVMNKRQNKQREAYLESTGMVLVEEWKLPKNRKGRIYVKESQ
jgi:hypothetical protein